MSPEEITGGSEPDSEAVPPIETVGTEDAEALLLPVLLLVAPPVREIVAVILQVALVLLVSLTDALTLLVSLTEALVDAV